MPEAHLQAAQLVAAAHCPHCPSARAPNQSCRLHAPSPCRASLAGWEKLGAFPWGPAV